MVKSGASAQALATVSNELRKINEKRLKNETDVNSFQSYVIKNDALIFDLKTKTIGLEITEENQRKTKIKDLKEIQDLEINQADYLARDYELRKLTLENLIKNNDQVVKDELATFEERMQAYTMFVEFKKQLVQLEYDEQNRLIDKELSDQTNEINKAYSDQIKEVNNALKEGTTTNLLHTKKEIRHLTKKTKLLNL